MVWVLPLICAIHLIFVQISCISIHRMWFLLFILLFDYFFNLKLKSIRIHVSWLLQVYSYYTFYSLKILFVLRFYFWRFLIEICVSVENRGKASWSICVLCTHHVLLVLHRILKLQENCFLDSKGRTNSYDGFKQFVSRMFFCYSSQYRFEYHIFWFHFIISVVPFYNVALN